jgi:hypothetical protein
MFSVVVVSTFQTLPHKQSKFDKIKRQIPFLKSTDDKEGKTNLQKNFGKGK